jgi:putative ABC transport system ATP-binding protein
MSFRRDAGMKPGGAVGGKDGEVVLSAEGLRKQYGSGPAAVNAVGGVSLTVSAGESVAIVGPSGCGKSTLLYLLSGLERATGGAVQLAGRDFNAMSETSLAHARRSAVGFVFQAFHLIDELTAAENVQLPVLLGGASPRAARERAGELLERVGLSARRDHLPSELSGGERQRVAIARAVANQPTVVFADEPTGNLDSGATTGVLRLFAQLHADGQTLVTVTHDSRVAATADRVLSMRDGVLVDETSLARSDGSAPGRLTGLDQ